MLATGCCGAALRARATSSVQSRSAAPLDEGAVAQVKTFADGKKVGRPDSSGCAAVATAESSDGQQANAGVDRFGQVCPLELLQDQRPSAIRNDLEPEEPVGRQPDFPAIGPDLVD
jgi:hypothetical protein